MTSHSLTGWSPRSKAWSIRWTSWRMISTTSMPGEPWRDILMRHLPSSIKQKRMCNCYFPNLPFKLYNELDFWVTGMNPLWPKLESQDGSPVARSLQVGYAYVPSFKNNFKISMQSFPTKKRKHMFKGVLLAQLRVQESLTLESRAKSIPLPKCKAAPKSNPKSAVKAKAKPKARAQAEDGQEEDAEPAPKRRAGKGKGGKGKWNLPCLGSMLTSCWGNWMAKFLISNTFRGGWNFLGLVCKTNLIK